MIVGRPVTVIGIAKRAYPGAADQRFSIVPRGLLDVRASGGIGSSGSTGGPAAAGREVAGAFPAIDSPAGLSEGIDVDLGALAEHAGQRVRVGGLVVEPTQAGFVLDDGTAIAAIVLTDEAAAYLGLFEPGDAVNVAGQVVADDVDPGAWLVRVTSAGDLLRVGDLGEPLAVLNVEGATRSDPPPPFLAITPVDQDARRLGLGEVLAGAGGGPAGVLSLALMSALSLGSALARRRRSRLQAARITARLARYAGPRSEEP
jgi:hypothetical protein